jgi:peroxiredoxin
MPLTRRTGALFFLLLIVAIVGAVRAYVTHRPLSMAERLHSDAEESITALSEEQATTPASQKIPQLIRMSHDPSPGLRFAAVDALEAQTGAAVADAIEAAFTDSSAAVRQRALEALPRVDPVRGRRLLLRGLQDEDSWLREAAATQFRLHGDRRDVPYLITALDDPDPAVSNMAMGALRKQTGQPFYASILATAAQQRAARTQWHDWWARSRGQYQPAGFVPLTPLRPMRMDPAPDFDLQDLSGKTVSLAAQHGRVTLLSFWGTWCPPCQQEIPDLVRLDTVYRPQKLDIIGVALSETSAATLAAWCRTHHVEYRQAQATDQILDAYGNVREVPVSVLIDRQGRIRYRWDGPRDYSTFRAAVTRLLAEPGD